MSLIKVHKVLEGPFEEGNNIWYNLCLVETECGDVIHLEVMYPSFDEAYEDINILSQQITPIEIEAPNYV